MIDQQRQIRDISERLERLEKTDIERFVGARVYNNAAITIANNTVTVLTFNSERFDTDSIHSTSVNTSRLTIPVSGYYMIGGHVFWETAGVGRRQLLIRANGSVELAAVEEGNPPSGTTVLLQSVATLYQLNASDYVELRVFQTSGGDLDVNSSASISPEFWIVRVG